MKLLFVSLITCEVRPSKAVERQISLAFLLQLEVEKFFQEPGAAATEQPNIVHEIGDLLLRLNAETGLTVLIVEQKLPFARRVASDFRILDKGRAVASGAIAELSDEMVRHHLTV